MKSRFCRISLFGFIILGCMNSSVNTDFKNYFFPIDKFDEPMVYEWEYKTDGNNFATYYIYKKISSNELEVSIINQDFITVSKFGYLYKKAGVYIKDINNFDIKNDGKIINEKVLDSLVYSYHFANSQSKYSTIFKPDANMTINRIVTRKLDYLDTIEFNGEKIAAIKSSGETKLIMTSKEYPNQEHTTITTDELVYGENLGVISHDSKSDTKFVQRRLKRIISIDEFEKIKSQK